MRERQRFIVLMKRVGGGAVGQPVKFFKKEGSFQYSSTIGLYKTRKKARSDIDKSRRFDFRISPTTFYDYTILKVESVEE